LGRSINSGINDVIRAVTSEMDTFIQENVPILDRIIGKRGKGGMSLYSTSYVLPPRHTIKY
jgi:hypothetical protein